MPIYREYLSKFTLSPFFRDKPLLTLFDDTLSKADGDLLIKLICGSFACTYLIDYNEEKGGLELTLHVETKEESRTGKLEELWPFQIVRFFEIYLDEQLYFEYLLKKECYNNIDDLKEEMDVRVVVFEQKMRALEEKYRQRKNDNEDIDSELDELLKS